MTEARAFGMGQYSHNNQPVSIAVQEGRRIIRANHFSLFPFLLVQLTIFDNISDTTKLPLSLQVHHILYLFAELGDRATTETTVRKVMERGYGTDFYAGESLA